MQTAEQCIYVLNAVDSKWVGLIVDTGNFKTPDPYKDIAEVVPYAVNWQIKESVFGIGSEVPTDYKRLVKIIKEGGYKPAWLSLCSLITNLVMINIMKSIVAFIG